MELMEGLTLLSTEVRNGCPILCYILAAICAIMVCIDIYFIIDTLSCRDYGCTILFLVLGLCLFSMGFIIFNMADEPPKTIYKVTIDESVPVVEFYERYEIIDQDGLIFTITEKGGSNE